MTVEKLYSSAPPCVQDIVDSPATFRPGGTVSDAERAAAEAKKRYKAAIHVPSRPRRLRLATIRTAAQGPSKWGALCALPNSADPENSPSCGTVTQVLWTNESRLSLPSWPGVLPGPSLSEKSTRRSAVRVDDACLSPVESLTAQPLGRYTKSSPPPSDYGRRKVRAERYEHLGTARDLLLAKGRAAGLEHPANYSRTAKCMHTPHGEVAVLRGTEHGTAFFRGLVACGSVWACPVCAAKVQERRREEIAKGFDWAYAEGLQPVMVTLTFPHRAWHELGDLVLQQREALKMLRKGRAWDKFMKDSGYQGLIRALEITHGRNGWHPHTHEVWMVSAEVKAVNLRKQVTRKWASACARAGLLDTKNFKQLRAFARHAVDVKGWCSTSDYLAKADDAKHWGADREMAKSSTKAGRAKGMHPFGLLAEAGAGDRRLGELFVEFVDTMKATRSRQLFWSSGLKKRVGLVEKTDEELAEEEREPADLLGLLERGDWERVRRHRKRAQLLDAAELGGWPAVKKLVESLRRRAQSVRELYASPSVAALPGPS